MAKVFTTSKYYHVDELYGVKAIKLLCSEKSSKLKSYRNRLVLKRLQDHEVIINIKPF